MEFWQAALLGLVQGLTEFFPVSSDGHLVALERWLDVRRAGSGASSETFLHVGTLLACFVAFRRELWAMLKLVREPRRVLKPAADDVIGQEGRFVLLGSIVTVVAVLPFLNLFEALYDSKPVLVASMVATGALLVLSKFALRLASLKPDSMQALLVGGAQMLAVLPGLSRSCTTVVVGMLVGIPVARVVELSFLLSVPAVLGATLLEFIRHPPAPADLGPLAVGVAVAFIAGLFAVKAMMRLVPRGRMHWFAPYMFLLAAAVAFFG